SSAQFGGARIDRGLAALVPADTILLSGIRMSEVRTTPLYNRMISQQRLSELNDFAKQTNFDQRKAVSDMMVASNGVDAGVVASGWGTLADKLSSRGDNLSNFGRVFRSLERVSGTADLRSGIVATFNGDCRTEQDAKTLGDAARGMVGLGRLSVPENQPEMLRLFDGIKVEQKQQSVQLNVNIPPDLIDRLIKLTETRR